ncbi:MAG: M15 family metallopeptidase [Saprospiraceae bacterium]|nr:M15 family metallopeptidase [Saprospiraceae bacterium]
MKYVSMLLLAALGWACQSDASTKAAMATAPLPATLTAVPDTLRPGAPAVDDAYFLGKFEPRSKPNFVSVGPPYSDRAGMLLRKEAFEAFKKMFAAAKKEGVALNIISATRNFAQQKVIWEGKWTRFAKDAPAPKDRALKILEYSSMPGSSRHHWGTDMDLNDLNNAAFESGGKHEKVYLWLIAHAHEYGFGQPYTAGRPTGYHEEKWHWSYLPLSRDFLAAYHQRLSEKDIQGFEGAETAVEIGIVKNYVLGINKDCW